MSCCHIWSISLFSCCSISLFSLSFSPTCELGSLGLIRQEPATVTVGINSLAASLDPPSLGLTLGFQFLICRLYNWKRCPFLDFKTSLTTGWRHNNVQFFPSGRVVGVGCGSASALNLSWPQAPYLDPIHAMPCILHFYYTHFKDFLWSEKEM